VAEEATAMPPEVPAEPEESPSVAASEKRSRRGRGRGRRKKDEPAPEREVGRTDEEEAPEPADTAPEADDIADEDIGNPSTWNVPSWNELIASLYRPDR
jgi:hypothetical protein